MQSIRGTSLPTLELWGGVECTINRVGDTFYHQLDASGHRHRLADLDLFAGLGIRTLRYPVLWEQAQAGLTDAIDWRWLDQRLGRLSSLAISPIAGLVHHGSGPRGTDLTDSSFAAGLEAFAQNVAERYPRIDAYTPVNEPLTTARFSGLYGHWYPHGRSDHQFARALLNQCRGVVRAMEAIRAINSSARLVQTEDLGKIYATPSLAYQADFENERRWLTWDILCGRVDKRHPLWAYLTQDAGIEEAELHWFTAHRCPPTIIGINYYVTSERFLDERLERYPEHAQGGNGRQAYADIEAVRVLAQGIAGPGAMIREAWQRYRLPIALTEVHLGCSREEQMRWLRDVWQAAEGQRARGVDMRAVTAWSLLGAFDWNSLLSRRAGCYEPGVFDLRGPQPRATGLASLIREFTSGHKPTHPTLCARGWWHRPDRLLYPEVGVENSHLQAEGWRASRWQRAQPILIVGGHSPLGQAFAHFCGRRGLAYKVVKRHALGSGTAHWIGALLARLRPWAVVNAADYANVDAAEREPWTCYQQNTEGPARLADACARANVALLTFSSDLVFDGRQNRPYLETDEVNPLSFYGHSKVQAEKRVLDVLPSALLVRTGAYFGPWDKHNFVTIAMRALLRGQRFAAADDMFVSPSYLPDLVNAGLDLLVDGERGVWHLSNAGAVSWAELASLAADIVRIDQAPLYRCATKQLGLRALRPPYSVLTTKRGAPLAALEDALERYGRECTQLSMETAVAI